MAKQKKTPKQMVTRDYPGSFSYMDSDYSWRIDLTGGLGAVGIGTNPKNAWASAARQLRMIK